MVRNKLKGIIFKKGNHPRQPFDEFILQDSSVTSASAVKVWVLAEGIWVFRIMKAADMAASQTNMLKPAT